MRYLYSIIINIKTATRKLAFAAVANVKVTTFVYLAITFCALSYLWQINSLATTGYEVTELESKKLAIEKQNDALGSKITELQSSEAIINKLDGLDMIPSNSITYIDIHGNNVALR